jgi:hypothetical protein
VSGTLQVSAAQQATSAAADVVSTVSEKASTSVTAFVNAIILSPVYAVRIAHIDLVLTTYVTIPIQHSSDSGAPDEH